MSVLGGLDELTLSQSVLDVHLSDDVVDAALNLDGEHGRGQARSVREHDQTLALLKILIVSNNSYRRKKDGKKEFDSSRI